jgi:hypothetical protein
MVGGEVVGAVWPWGTMWPYRLMAWILTEQRQIGGEMAVE